LIHPYWNNFQVAFKNALEPFNIDPDLSFFPELMLLVGGLDKSLKISQTQFGPDRHQQYVVLEIMLNTKELNTFAENFRNRFPNTLIRFDNESPTTEEASKTLLFSLNEITQYIIPLIATLSTPHPTFLARHQNNAYQVGYHLGKILSKYNICASQTDAIEETICRVVQRVELYKFIIISRQFVMHFYQRGVLPLEHILKF
jgi:hypothetical protein